MKKIEITVYSIDELKDRNIKAYNKVIDDMREIIIDDNFNFAASDASVLLKEKYNLNIDPDNIYYSITSSQGDGVCFIDDNILSYTNIKNKSDDSNIFEKWIINNLSDDEMTLLLDYLNSNYNLKIVKKTHNYCHAHTCIIDYEYFYSSDDDKYIERMNNFIYDLSQKLFNDVYIDVCGDIEKMLYKYYDIDDDDVIEFINNNEYLFTIEGDIY